MKKNNIMTSLHKRLEVGFAAMTAWVYDHKYIAIFIMIMVTLLFGSQLPKLTIDTREEGFFHPSDPIITNYNDFRDQFGQDNIFFVVLQPEAGFTPEVLQLLAEVHHDLEQTLPYLDEVTSLVNGRMLRAEGDTLITEDLMAPPPQTEAEVKRLYERIASNPLYEDLLVSEDHALALILVKPKAILDESVDDVMAGFEMEEAAGDGTAPTRYITSDQNMEIYEAINKVLEKYRGRGVDFHLAGNPVFTVELFHGILKDMGRMIPLSFMVITVFLILLFRRISGVVYPLITVFFSLVSCMGIMAIWGIPITNVIQILPTFLIVVGIGDSVHVLTIFYRNFQQSNDKRRAIIDAVAYTGLPVLMTSLTTAVGLLSFIWADIAVIAQLGYIAPVGVFLALLYSLVLLPTLIAVFPVKMKKATLSQVFSPVDSLFDRITRLTTGRPWWVVTVSGVIVALALSFALTVRFSHNAMKWLPEDSPVRIATELLEEKNSGSVMLEVLIDTGKPNGLHEPEFLSAMDQAADSILKMAVNQIQAIKVLSLVDVVKEANKALNQDDPAAYVIPDTRQMVAQELALFESSGSDDLQSLTDSTYQIGRMTILAPFADSILYKDYADQLMAFLKAKLTGASLAFTGNMALFIAVTKLFITSMAKSYVFALVVITVLMVFMVGRIKIGLMSMIANVVPLILIFGIMGIASIPLDMVSIIIGSLVLGLVVDDTMHFLHHFRRAYDQSHNVAEAVRHTLYTTGRAMVTTSLVLCGGFFIYTTAYLTCNINFGLLSGCAVIFALVADFLLVPALLTLVYDRQPRTQLAATPTGGTRLQPQEIEPKRSQR